jgi:hypothetical protein
LRLQARFSQLPKELYDEINVILNKDVSRHTAIKELEQMLSFCLYWEAVIESEKLEKKLQEIESNLGLSEDDFSNMSQFLKEHSMNVAELL